MIDELVTRALLGTRGSASGLSPLPEELAGALPSEPGEAEAQLLDFAAAATLYERAGTKPRSGIAPPPVCAADRRRECSSRLADLLAQSLTEGLPPLVAEWIALAVVANVRPPHRLLPKLLETATAKRDLQSATSIVIDERGRWLTQFNARWRFASPSRENPEDAWHVGNRQQRAAALRAMRAADPALAREWIAATWKEDGADERAEWVGILLDRLSEADEEFLESCLDDRSTRVREAAADLLGRLPDSRLVRRMIERVTPLISFHAGTPGSMLKLKRGTKAQLEVRLPETCDKAMLRDGIAEKPSEKIGPRQWWLVQMLGYIPLDYWTNTFSVPAAEIVAAVPADEAGLLVRGWWEALARRPIGYWIEPLVQAAGANLRLEVNVLRAIPREQRISVLRCTQPKSVDLAKLLEAWSPLDEAVSQTVLEWYDPATILGCEAYFYLHPDVLPVLFSHLTESEHSSYLRRQIDRALMVINLRGELHKEFAR